MIDGAGTLERPARAGDAPPARHAPARSTAPGAAGSRRDFADAIERALAERRLFILVPFAIIAGLIAATQTTQAPEGWALLSVGTAMVLALLLSVRSLTLLRLLVLLAGFWLGFSLLTIHGGLFGTAMLRGSAYGTYDVHVDEIISEDTENRRMIVSAILPAEGSRELPIRRARLFSGMDLDVAPGDVLRAPIRFYPVPGPVLPGGYDSQFHAYFDGVGAYATTTGGVERVATGETAAPARVVDAVRRALGTRIDAVLAQPSAGIARALVTGDQSAVTDEARETMASAGLAHVLSISGLHLTLVAGGVFVAMRILLSLSDRLARRISVKRLAGGAGIIAALLYFSISGGNVAALRATVMIVLVFGAVIFGRRALTMRNVAIAALVVLLTDPASVFRPSFQLSFAAVVALIGTWELVKRQEERARGVGAQLLGYFGGIVATSLVAGGATLLFSAYHFQQTSPLGVLGNLVSLPLVGFVMMPAGLLAVLATPLGLEAPFLGAMGWSIDRMLDLAGVVASWSSGLDASPLLTPMALVIGLVALGWFAFFSNRWRLVAPALALPAVLLFGLDRPPDLLIADTTQAVAIRTTDGLQLVTGRPDSFAVDVWSETYAEPIDGGAFACDGVGCIAEGEAGFTLAIVDDPSGFYEDCALADVVVTRRRAPSSCAAPLVIDAGDLRRGGVHWLRWTASGFEVRPAMTDLNQPWRSAPQ